MDPIASENLSLEALQAELLVARAVEREYRLLLDESSDPIFAFFPDGTYRYVNRAFADGVGKPLGEIVGRKIWDVFSKEEADKRFAVVRWVFENVLTKVIEVRVPREDGDRYYVTTVKPIIDSAGSAISVICISKEITERKRMEEQLAHQAQHDSLTELPNRTLIADRLERAIAQAQRDSSRLALLVLDLDAFKPVNDAYGHYAGDLLLRAVASRILHAIREADSAGRLGGDEFLVLLPQVDSGAAAVMVAEKIRASIAQPFELPGLPPLHISVSVGLAIFPDHADNAVDLAKTADHCMYVAKRQGCNRVQLADGGSESDSQVTKQIDREPECSQPTRAPNGGS